ncbi:hypothetical protein HY522_06195, partial [bacterium]|nr:hypothetical protein [bacterium]
PSTIRQALEGETVDMAEEIPPSLIVPLKNSKNVAVRSEISHSHYGQTLYLNHTKAPFNNLDVRKALAYAINYDRLVPVWQGTATLAGGPFPPTFRPWVAEKAIVQYRHDLAKSRDYLTRAGLSMPISPPLRVDILWQAGFTAMRDMAQLIAEDWAKIGVQINIVETPLPIWREAIWKHTFDVAFMQSPLRYNDPDSLASLFYHSKEFRYRGWNPGYRNPRVDEIIEVGRTTLEPTKRLEYYTEFQRIVTDEVMMIHLVNKLDAFAYRREIEGIRWNPNYGPHYRAYELRKNPTPK